MIVPSLLSLFRLSITTGRVFTSWKTARLTPVYKKDDETDCCNYRPISLLSVPSKILESVVNDTIVRHVYKANNLVTDKQWAYRAGFSTELLLIQLTETWREAVDAGLVVAVAFIDFKKAFDSVSHAILETKLERDFGISGLLLDWLKSYLKERQQYTAVNGSTSEMIPISFGIPQGSVLGPTLFTLFNCIALTKKKIPYRDLRLKLKSQANFNECSFQITSASNCNFCNDFVYT